MSDCEIKIGELIDEINSELKTSIRFFQQKKVKTHMELEFEKLPAGTGADFTYTTPKNGQQN